MKIKLVWLRVKVRRPVLSIGYVVGVRIFIFNPLATYETGFLTLA
jgi:hypothetical protein